MHGHDQGHGRLLRSKSVLHAVFAKTTAAPVQATKLKLDEETRWQIAGEAIEELQKALMRDLAPSTGPHNKRERWKVKPEK